MNASIWRSRSPGRKLVLQQHAVLQCLVPALDLALGLGMEGRAARMVLATPSGFWKRELLGAKPIAVCPLRDLCAQPEILDE
jgi:hypothetical protein